MFWHYYSFVFKWIIEKKKKTNLSLALIAIPLLFRLTDYHRLLGVTIIMVYHLINHISSCANFLANLLCFFVVYTRRWSICTFRLCTQMNSGRKNGIKMQPGVIRSSTKWAKSTRDDHWGVWLDFFLPHPSSHRIIHNLQYQIHFEGVLHKLYAEFGLVNIHFIGHIHSASVCCSKWVQKLCNIDEI